MNKYILALFTIVFTLNALESDIEVVESFGFEDSNVEVIDVTPTAQEEQSFTQTPVKQAIKEKVEQTLPAPTISAKTAKTIKKQVAKKDTNKTKKVTKKTKTTKPKKALHKKAQLAIIIDDVSHASEIRFLKSLPYHITPSIFPPTRMNMHSNRLAKNLKHFMVHLPLESDSRAMNKMYKMLFVKDSNKKIRDRVKEIRKLFPNAKYINNHTGSVFSSNYAKSKVLYKALKKEGFIFLDSRTSQRTKFKRIARELGYKYYKSDIFIDNVHNVNYTLNKIKQGVRLAKRRGYAVMIGHPHATTFKALKKAIPFLKEVNMVYIDELKF